MTFLAIGDIDKPDNIELITSITSKQGVYFRIEDNETRMELTISKEDAEYLHSFLGTFLKQKEEL